MTDVVVLTDAGWAWRGLTDALTGCRVVVADRRSHSTFPILAGEVGQITDLVSHHRMSRPVLVADASAAFAAEAYARTAQTSALVLIDPPAGRPLRPHAITRAALRTTVTATHRVGRLIDSPNAVGPVVWRWRLRLAARTPPSPAVNAAAHAAYRGGHAMLAAVAEELAYRDLAFDLNMLRRGATGPAIPVRVLTSLNRRSPASMGRRRLAVHHRLADSFPFGTHVPVWHPGHVLALERPETVIQVIESVIGEGPSANGLPSVAVKRPDRASA